MQKMQDAAWDGDLGFILLGFLDVLRQVLQSHGERLGLFLRQKPEHEWETRVPPVRPGASRESCQVAGAATANKTFPALLSEARSIQGHHKRQQATDPEAPGTCVVTPGAPPKTAQMHLG